MLPRPLPWYRFSGAPAFWDTGTPNGVPALQRRPSSVVTRWVAGKFETTLLARAAASL